MKKIYLSILSIGYGLAVNAQTLTQAANAPAVGDSYTLATCNGTVVPGAQGPNVLYNFASVSLTSTLTAYSAATSTNTTYNPATIDVSDNNGGEAFYLSSPTDLKYYGGNMIIAGVPVTLKYTSPAVYAAYPMAFGTATNSATGGTLSALSSNGTFTGAISVLADGTGTVVLPGRSFTNILRVVTSQTINFDVPSFGITNAYLNQVNYDYYSPVSKTPLFTISTSTAYAPPLTPAPTSQTVLTVASNYLTVGIAENSKDKISLVVFPNPANSTINFITASEEAKQVLMYDITGKLIDKLNLNEGKLKLNVLDYNAGLYIYSVIGNSNQTLTTGKITVSH